jgi:MoaA/NifB/PqqE/SkfB family radical SAM enzyme
MCRRVFTGVLLPNREYVYQQLARSDLGRLAMNIAEHLQSVFRSRVPTDSRIEPFLHVEQNDIYNPLTDRRIGSGEEGYIELGKLASGELDLSALQSYTFDRLKADGWIVKDEGDLSSRYRLKYVSLEANTACNQGCYFCPVSTHPRESFNMSLEFYEEIVQQLAEFKDTLEGVSMIHYNEPTIDKRFVQLVGILKKHGIPPAVLTNATGLTPAKVDAILAMGGLKYLSINLSTLDRERYAKDRGGDHLPIVLRNLDYLKNLPLADTMDMAVLGQGDEVHRSDFKEIEEHFASSRFAVKYYEVMDRAGNAPIGIHPNEPLERLCGCEQTGSRPLQWMHITPHGKCVLCCQDYHDQYVVGDLHEESLREIMEGPRMSLMRRWVYGLEEAPRDFICRKCIYARTR